MAQYENQKTYYIKKFETITHKEKTSEQFLQPIDWKYYLEAMQTLSGNAFKLWLYLLKWNGTEGHKYEFSPASLMKQLGISSKNTIYAAAKELMDKHYTVRVSENHIDFYPCGHADLICQIMN